MRLIMGIELSSDRLEEKTVEDFRDMIAPAMDHFITDQKWEVTKVYVHLADAADGKKGMKFWLNIIAKLSGGQFAVVRLVGNTDFSWLKRKLLTGEMTNKDGSDPYQYDQCHHGPTEFACEAAVESWLHKKQDYEKTLRLHKASSEWLTEDFSDRSFDDKVSSFAMTSTTAQANGGGIPVIKPRSEWSGDW